MFKRLLGIVGIVLILQSSAEAQISYGANDDPSQILGATLVAIDFSFDGDAPSEIVFEFSEPAYGIFYARPGLSLSVMRGTQKIADRDLLTLTDITLSGFSSYRPFKGRSASALDVFFPISLTSNYRRIIRAQDNTEVDAFEYTVIAAGAGLGIASGIWDGQIMASAVPYFGIASRSFGNDTDTSAIFAADIEWISGPVSDRYGISLGYQYRWQKWYSDMGDLTGSSFDFVGKQHSLRLGISF